jgi:DNA-binding GntR family transcriptional regulator
MKEKMPTKKKGSPTSRNSARGATRIKRHGHSDDAIYQEMFRAIIEHRIPPGTALQEDALAATFGVSRTIIRKVLQRLSHEHLVDLVPNRGGSVAKPSAEEARKVFDARRVVERILIERLATHISDDEINELSRFIIAEKAAFESGNKQDRLRLSGDFHRLLASLAGNDVLADFLNELISRTSLIIALYESPGAVPCSHGEHMEIVGALRRRDAKKSAQYMDHHLQHIEAQIELSEIYEKVDFKSVFEPMTRA